MHLIRVALVALLLVACAQSAWASSEPAPPTPSEFVTDNAGMLSPGTRDSLNQRLQAYSQATGHQVLVWIGTTTGDTPLEDWTINAFTAWKVGRKGIDDGLVLFIFSQDRKMRIEVGYGLEGVVTDAIASRIIRTDIAPLLQQGNPDAAVTAGVNALLQTIGGEPGNAAQATAEPSSATADNQNNFWVGLLIFFVLFAIFLAFSRAARRYYTVGSGPYMGTWGGGGFGGGWGGGGGGGGFSGGGGSGGGGGASGGW